MKKRTLVCFVLLSQLIKAGDTGENKESNDLDWNGLLWQSGFFLAVEHAFRFGTEPATRDQLKGKFFDDWGQAIRGLGGWRDSDPFLVNYVGHPMQGAVTGHIFIHNYKPGKSIEFENSARYWKSRLKAMAWSAAYSTQFELGPVSEASLGNLGSRAVPGTMGYVDLVVTPLAGFGVQVTEDVIDRHIIRRLENKIRWGPAVIAFRGVLNPARSFANCMRLKVPWARDTRPGAFEIGRHRRGPIN